MRRDFNPAITQLRSHILHLLLGSLVALQATIMTTALLRADEIPKSVVRVIIEGNETIPASIIQQKILTQPGRPVTNRQLREDHRNLMNTRLFYNVSERF